MPPLLMSRRLAPLLITQSLGAINDNLFKNALVVLILFRAAEASGPVLVALAGGVFILPYVLLSATAGQIADRFEKSRTILIVKCGELALMVLAAVGFLVASTPLLFAVLFGLGVQATFFSPLKIAILPSHLAERELVAGNGLMEAGTFLGILLGTIAGPLLFAGPGGPTVVAAAGLAVALAGIASAALVPPAPSTVSALRIGGNPFRATVSLLRMARASPTIWRCLLALSWFWAIGAIVLAELPSLVRLELDAGPPVFTLLLAAFSIGVALGSLSCARLLRGEVSARLVPLAALGLSIFLCDFAFATAGAHRLPTVSAILHSAAGWHLLADLLLLAACGGLYSVPLYAVIQDVAEPGELARMIAANNVLNAGAMVGSAVATAALAAWSLPPSTILLIAAAVNLLVAAWSLRLRSATAPPQVLSTPVATASNPAILSDAGPHAGP